MSCYYRTCPLCGAHLDPGGLCDCRDEEAAVSVASTGGGGVEHVDHAVSASNDTTD